MSSSHRGRAAASQQVPAAAPPPPHPMNDVADGDADVLRLYPSIDRSLFESRAVLHDPPVDSTLRFLLATDNHLGFAENDSIRRDDSFLAFEEILVQASLHDVDFLLLGGDLFHENKPSRPTFYRALNLLRHHVLGDRPVQFELVSDGAKNFPLTGRANYEDENVNVSIPVFSIHGNHDDPAGMGQFSAMDLLHEARLLNYWGKAERVDAITCYPILIRKGDTKVALYGLGNVRDERLHRTFASGGVKWVRPEDDAGDWFNICVLHQNRIAHSVHDKAHIPAKMLPDFLDMVVWGHEHECQMDSTNEEGEFVIIQPGSSVATSLSQGEAVDKHVALIEIRGDKFRLMQIPLYTTRPFVIDDVTLSEEVDANQPNPAAAVDELLTNKVNDVLDRIAREPKFANPDRPKPPLVRLRVEHTGFARLNVSKFGQKFVGRVANPDDLLLFYKQKAPSTRRSGGQSGKNDLDLSALRGDVDDAPPISEIVSQLIARRPLSVLNEDGLADAIEEFVEKKTPDVIQEFVKRDLKTVQSSIKQEKEVISKGGSLSTDFITETVKKRHDDAREKAAQKKGVSLRAKKEEGKDVLEGLDEAQLHLLGINRGDSDDDEREEKEEKKPGSRAKTAARGGAAGGRGRGRGGRGGKATTSSRQRSKVERDDDDDGDARPRSRGDSDGGYQGGGRGGDDFVDADFDEDEGEDEWGPASAPKAAPSSRAKQSARSSRLQAVDEQAEVDEDETQTQLDEDAVIPAPKRSRVKAEPAIPVTVGGRNRAGELSFLMPGGGGGGRKKPAAAAAAPSAARNARGRGRGDAAPSNVVDLSQDFDD